MAPRTTPEQRRRLIARYRRSGLTQQEFAQREGISLSALQNWLYRRREEEGAPPRFVEVEPPAIEALEVRVGSVEARLPLSWGDERLLEFLSGLARRTRQ